MIPPGMHPSFGLNDTQLGKLTTIEYSGQIRIFADKNSSIFDSLMTTQKFFCISIQQNLSFQQKPDNRIPGFEIYSNNSGFQVGIGKEGLNLIICHKEQFVLLYFEAGLTGRSSLGRT